MAKIPTLGTATNINKSTPDIQGPSITRAAMEGEALGRLASNVGDIAFDIMEKRQQAETSVYGDASAREFRQGMEDFTSQARLEAAGDHKGFSENVRQEMNRRRQQFADNAPSQEARNYFLKRTEDDALQLGVGAHSYENAQRAKFYDSTYLKDAEAMSSRYYDNPDPFKANGEVLDFQNDILRQKGVLYTEAEALGMTEKVRKNVRGGVLRGMIRDDLSGLAPKGAKKEEALKRVDAFLAGGISGTENLLAGMTDEEKVKFRNEAESVLSTRDRTNHAETAILTKNAITALAEGKGQDPRYKSGINETWTRLNAMEDSPQKTLALRSMVNARKVGDLVDGMHYMNPSEMSQKIESVQVTDGNLLTKDVDDDFNRMLVSSTQTLIAEREKDGKAYIQKHHPTMANDPQMAYLQQKALGISNARVLSKQESRLTSQAIMEGATAKQRAELFDAHMAKYGAMSPQAVVEMSKDNPGFPKEMTVALHFDNTVTKEIIFDNLLPAKAKAIEADFAATKKGQSSTLNEEVSKQMGAIQRVFYESNRPDQADTFRRLVTTQAKRMMLEDPNLDAAKAVSYANKVIVTDNFETYEDPRNRFLIPKHLGADRRAVETFMVESLEPATLKKLGLDPSVHLAQGTVQSEKEFWDNIKKYGRWEQAEGEDGVRLYIDSPQGAGYLKTNERQVVTAKFKDMSQIGSQMKGTARASMFDKYGRRILNTDQPKGKRETSSTGP